MIREVFIRNFKSITGMKLECRRVNVFIGRPNVGKSNILEAIGLFSLTAQYKLSDFVRLATIADLFHDQNLQNEVTVRCDNLSMILKLDGGHLVAQLGKRTSPGSKEVTSLYDKFSYSAEEVLSSTIKSPIRYYRFRVLQQFARKDLTFLLPPWGENLVALLNINKELRDWFKGILNGYGLRLNLKPLEDKIEIVKEVDDTLVGLPFFSLAETLQRLLFYTAAMRTNKGASILLEEPEAHLFPHYAKYLAERIAMFETDNQYFLSTHNPYFLNSLIEKTPISDLAVFAVGYSEDQTQVHLLTGEQLSEILDLDTDVFFNLEEFVKE